MSKLTYNEMQFLKRNKQRQGLSAQEAYESVGKTLKGMINSFLLDGFGITFLDHHYS